MSWSKQTVVGIFSRSGAEEYPWLVNALNDITGISLKPFVITNSNASGFREAVCASTFAILYHSMNRGRLNITDVTDSLYEEELQFLFITLGKDKVVVIADDLVDSSDDAKNNILRSQPTIGLEARDIFLFSKNDKTIYNIMMCKMALIKEIITAASGKRPRKWDEDKISPDKKKNLKPRKASTCVSVISHAITLVTLRWACSDPTPVNLSLLFAWTMASLLRRLYTREPDNSTTVSLVTCGTTIMCVTNALLSPSLRNWALVIPWAAASLGLVRNTFHIPYIPAGLRLSETYLVPAGVVTILSIFQPDWPHILLSYFTFMSKKHEEITLNETIGLAR